MENIESADGNDSTLHCTCFGGPRDGFKTGDLPAMMTGANARGHDYQDSFGAARPLGSADRLSGSLQKSRFSLTDGKMLSSWTEPSQTDGMHSELGLLGAEALLDLDQRKQRCDALKRWSDGRTSYRVICAANPPLTASGIGSEARRAGSGRRDRQLRRWLRAPKQLCRFSHPASRPVARRNESRQHQSTECVSLKILSRDGLVQRVQFPQCERLL